MPESRRRRPPARWHLAIARAIPGATFIGHSGMGHDLPRTLWRTLAADILSLVDRVDAGAPSPLA